jgi:streptogramin lyase
VASHRLSLRGFLSSFFILVILCLSLIPLASLNAQTIDSVVGGQPPQFFDSQGVGLDPRAVHVDSGGTVFLLSGNMIFLLYPDGQVEHVVGTGGSGYSGDGGPALDAEFRAPTDIGLAPSFLYVADAGNFRIRRVDEPTLTIVAVAGNGVQGYSGDNGPATDASIGHVTSIALDSTGGLWIADATNFNIRHVDAATGIIRTAAQGSGVIIAPLAKGIAPPNFGRIASLAIDPFDNLYIADETNRQVFLMDPTGVLTALVFDDSLAAGGDGSGPLLAPQAVTLDFSGTLYVADLVCAPGEPNCLPDTFQEHRVRMVPSGTNALLTVAGGGSPPDGLGDGPALGARLGLVPSLAAWEPGAEVLIADRLNRRVRALVSGQGGIAGPPGPVPGDISTRIGNGATRFSGDGGDARSALLGGPGGVAVAADGSTWFADTLNDRIRFVAADGTISTIAGGGSPPDGVGDGLAAVEASLNRPNGIAVDSARNIWIADSGNSRIRLVDGVSGIIKTVVGGGDVAPASGLLGTDALLQVPSDIVVSDTGELWFSDRDAGRVYHVDTGGRLTVFAGGGALPPQDVPAIDASLASPGALARSSLGDIYIADEKVGHVLRVRASAGLIEIVAGGGAFADPPEEDIPATESFLFFPCGLFVEADGTLWISECAGHRIRIVSAITGFVQTVVGTGLPGFSGDGGLPGAAEVNVPGRLVVDDNGVLFFSDRGNHRIRQVTGILTRPPLTAQPDSGTVNGGGTVQISGSGFFASSKISVLFGGNSATDIQLVDDQTLLVTVPPGSIPAQNVEISVTVDGITDTVTGGYTYLNDVPLAYADPDDPDDGYLMSLGMSLALDGSNSGDPNEGIGDAIALYEWDLDDDGVYDIQGPTPLVDDATLTSLGLGVPGLFPIALRVTDLGGAQAQAATTVLVIALTLFPNTGSVSGGDTVTLTSAGIDLTTTLSSIRFDNVALPGFLFINNQTVDLVVPPDQVLVRTVEVLAEIRGQLLQVLGGFTYLNDPPTANAIIAARSRYTIRIGQPLGLNGSDSSDPNAAVGDRIVSYEWDLDGDGEYDRRGVKVTLDFSELESFGLGTPAETSVALRVVDLHGAEGVGTADVTILPPPVEFPNDDYRDWIWDKDGNKLDDRLEKKPDTDRMDLVACFKAGVDLDSAALRFAPFTDVPPLRVPEINGLCLKQVLVGDARNILATDPDLWRVEEEILIEADLASSSAAIQAQPSPDYSPFTTVDRAILGRGVNVAILDSGVDDDHPALAGKFVAGFDAFFDDPALLGSQSNPDDDMDFAAFYHGTHMAGIVLGADPAFPGVATGAKLIDVKVLDNFGRATSATLLSGLQWCVNNRNHAWSGQSPEHHGIDVVCLSLSAKRRSDGNDLLSMMVDTLVDAGIIVVAASGNSSALGQGLGSPGAADGAIAVAAVDDKGTVDRGDDTHFALSNFGPRMDDSDGNPFDELKPDVCAYGVNVTSTAGGIAGLPGFGNSTQTGSSIACAHVAGMAALMLEALGPLSPADVKEILRNTAEPRGVPFDTDLDPTWSTTFGKGIVNAFAASFPDDFGHANGVWIASGEEDVVTAIGPDDAPSPLSQPLPGAPYSIGGGREPLGIAIDGNGNVWLTNRLNASVTKLNSGGQVRFRLSLIAFGVLPDQDLLGVAIDPANNAWVTLESGNSVLKITPSGLVDGGPFPVGSSPVAIAADRFSNVWTSNSGSNNVTKLGATGAQVPGSPFSVGLQPEGIVCDRQGRVYVANRGSDDVSILNNDGTLIGNFAAGVNPMEITIDFNGDCWVSNDQQSEINRLPGGGGPATVFPFFGGPRGISVAGDKTIWVSDYNTGLGRSVHRFGDDGTFMEVVFVDFGPLNRGDSTGLVHANSVDPGGDADSDGSLNSEEIDIGTNPFDPDSFPITVTSVTPAFGSVSGGTELQILGTGLLAPLEIFVGGQLTGSPTQIIGGVIVTAPAGVFPPLAPVDVRVRRNPAPPVEVTVPGAFEYRNDSPVADPDDGYFVIIGDPLLLDGSASFDPNGAIGDAIVSYLWDVNGNAVVGVTPTISAAQLVSFGMGSQGTYQVSLTLEDTLGLTGVQTADVFVLSGAAQMYVRGRANFDSRVDIADAIFTLLWIFFGETEPPCLDAADFNGDSAVDIADAIYLLLHLFFGNEPPPMPYPNCDLGPVQLGCESPSSCD